MTTAEVVAGLGRERARLLQAVDALGPAAETRAVTEPGGWTAKDVLGHLIHYAGQIAFGLGAALTPPPYVVAATGRLDPQEWNDRAVAHWRPFALEEVRAEFEGIADLVAEQAQRRSDDEMNATSAVPWAGPVSLWQFIGNDTFLGEWPAHAAQIEAAAAGPAS